MSKILFVIPYAGGSSYSMQGISKTLDGIDVCLLELPGRGKAIGEPLIKSTYDATNYLFNQVKSIIEKYDEYFIFGHSMGSLLGYLLIHKLLQNNFKLPSYFFVSGRSGPSKIDLAEDKKTYLLPSDKLREKLRELGGCPEDVLNNEELMDFFEPIIRADFQVIETFNYKELPPLSIPIKCFHGRNDEVKLEDVKLWSRESIFPIEIIEFSGNHFFIFDNWENISNEIVNVYANKKNR